MLRGWLALTLAALLCCTVENSDDDDGGSTGASAGGSGPLKPPPNGVQMTEDDACNRLQMAFIAKKLELCGNGTGRTCNGFLQAQYDPDCMMYDQGSVEGCVAHFQGMTRCEDLVETSCVLTGYPETAPSGCAQQ